MKIRTSVNNKVISVGSLVVTNTLSKCKIIIGKTGCGTFGKTRQSVDALSSDSQLEF